ncbi:hypothetical protein EVAR_3090_1 [Eumeta japonica]|uniref:Uncharacterized protein n=1 Tax=Eumeta variegata TaxID=151549 RepID=A0A4C1SWD8_EUMVA|nr:hypothetical protein EVAR_3090_1 [Eumeta japonica]
MCCNLVACIHVHRRHNKVSETGLHGALSCLQRGGYATFDRDLILRGCFHKTNILRAHLHPAAAARRAAFEFRADYGGIL